MAFYHLICCLCKNCAFNCYDPSSKSCDFFQLYFSPKLSFLVLLLNCWLCINYILSNILQARSIPFDVNFMNFEDPDVFERLTGPDYQKYWKETYGFDWVNQEKTIGMFIVYCLLFITYYSYQAFLMFSLSR